MITSIEIKRLRGIREGRLDDLTPLVVLVGPNGCGKSTVLDGLLIGASPTQESAVQEVADRHQPVPNGLVWLLWRAGAAGAAEISYTTASGDGLSCELSLTNGAREAAGDATVAIGIRTTVMVGELNEGWWPADSPSPANPAHVRLVEPGREPSAEPLHDLYSDIAKLGLRREVLHRLRALIPNLDSLEILTENGQPVLHLVYPDRSVPAVLAGDGILALLRVSLELASQPGGVVLVEEPEVHQHPGALLQTARAIWATVDRDVQVILTTHSLELIDFLVAEANEARIDKLSVCRLALNDGELVSSRNAGSDVQFAREQIEYDLR